MNEEKKSFPKLLTMAIGGIAGFLLFFAMSTPVLLFILAVYFTLHSFGLW